MNINCMNREEGLTHETWARNRARPMGIAVTKGAVLPGDACAKRKGAVLPMLAGRGLGQWREATW